VAELAAMYPQDRQQIEEDVREILRVFTTAGLLTT
jgi:hypothetical protein